MKLSEYKKLYPVTSPLNREGADWYDIGAVLRWRGRWHRTLPAQGPKQSSGPFMDEATKHAIAAMTRLDRGMIRCIEYLVRTKKHFLDLPIWTAEFMAIKIDKKKSK